MKNFLYIIIAAAVIIGLFFYLKPKQNSETQNKTFDLLIKDKKLVSGPETIQVSQGDNVTISITCDTDEEFHLHGYNKAIDLTANKPSVLTFSADLTGRFEYELEGSSTQIGVLEVLPK